MSVSTKAEVSTLQKSRWRLVTVFLLLCVAGFVLLEILGQQEKSMQTVSAFEYMTSDNGKTHSDSPLPVATVPDLESVGTSEDGSIIGYKSAQPTSRILPGFIIALCADGWMVESDDKNGLIGLRKDNGSDKGASYLLVQCMEVGGGTSIVVKRW